jgi:leucine dehydrogenase
VAAAIAAALAFLDRDLPRSSVVVLGAGHVGAPLARLLAGAGATVKVSDLDPVRAGAVAATVGGSTVPVSEALGTPCDVLAPCAASGVLTMEVVGELACRVVCGAANDVLAARRVAQALAERDILYVPDFVANAGGVLAVHSSLVGGTEGELRLGLGRIGARVSCVLERARRTGGTPLEVAELETSERLGRPVRVPD